MGNLRRAGVAILAFCIPLGSARAQDGDHPIEARGLTSGDMVSVAPMSAALGIAVPIGQAYDVGPSLSYGLTAIYNANIWDFDVICSIEPETGNQTCLPSASPSRSSELGLGWTIGLGRLIPPGHSDNPGSRWQYVAADGSSHAFFDTLHEGETPVSGWKYTRDGSYLRMYTNGGSLRYLDFPNGVRHKFMWTGTWDTHVYEMADQYGNWVLIDQTNPRWKITDSRGREHFVRFGDDAEIGKYVTQIELDGIGGQTRYWTFDYAWRWVSRTCRVSSGPTKYYVPLLRAINGPEGIAYLVKRDDNGGPDYELGNTSASCSDISGVPKSFRLPTKGKYTFTWALWDFPASTEGSHKESAAGINTVTSYDPYSGQSATTTYSIADYAYESRTTVTSPTGVKTIHYFTLPWNCSDCQRDWTFGLPYTVNQSTVADGTTLYLSTETKGPSNEPLSSTWVRFTRDYFTNGPHSAPFDWRMQSNRRLRMSRTYEGALADGRYRQTKVDTTTFDGAGHHRKTTTTSYFGPTPAEQPNSVSIVNYNPGSSCANPEASGCVYQLPSTSSRWILGRFDYTQIENAAGGDRARTDYLFDSSTGFLNEVRTRKSEGSTQNADIRVRYTPNADGTIAREEWFGGDNGNQTTPTYALGVKRHPVSRVKATSTFTSCRC